MQHRQSSEGPQPVLATESVAPAKPQASLKDRIKASPLFGVVKRAKGLLGVADAAMVSVLSSSRLGSSVYYSLFSRAFDREHHAVLLGRRKFTEQTRSQRASNFLLRRNIHRLEKGLSLTPRRPTFAADYIGETIEAYRLVRVAEQHRSQSSEELLWAFDVLTDYFAANASHPKIDLARGAFGQLLPPTRCEDAETQYGGLAKRSPFERRQSPPTSISYEDMLNLAKRRRSVRYFEDRPVPRELLDKVVDVARYAPTACNRLPYSFRVIDDYKMVQEAAGNAGGTAGYKSSIQSLIVVVGHCSAYFDERDRHLIYIDSSLASMSLMFAAETLGLSTCAINWSDVEWRERKMAKLLNLPPDDRVIMLIAIGYGLPESKVPFSAKKTVAELRNFN